MQHNALLIAACTLQVYESPLAQSRNFVGSCPSCCSKLRVARPPGLHVILACLTGGLAVMTSNISPEEHRKLQ